MALTLFVWGRWRHDVVALAVLFIAVGLGWMRLHASDRLQDLLGSCPDEGTLDLPNADGGVDGMARVMQQVGAQELPCILGVA
jgi:hypothetical protein